MFMIRGLRFQYGFLNIILNGKFCDFKRMVIYDFYEIFRRVSVLLYYMQLRIIELEE